MKNLLLEYNQLCEELGVCSLGAEETLKVLYGGKPLCNEKRFQEMAPKLYTKIKDMVSAILDLKKQKIKFTIEKVNALNSQNYEVCFSDNTKLFNIFCVTVQDLLDYMCQKLFNKITVLHADDFLWNKPNFSKDNKYDQYCETDEGWSHLTNYGRYLVCEKEPKIYRKSDNVIADIVYLEVCISHTTRDYSPRFGIIFTLKGYDHEYNKITGLHKVVMKKTDSTENLKQTILNNFFALYQEKFLATLDEKQSKLCSNDSSINFSGINQRRIPEKLNIFRSVSRQFRDFVKRLGESDEAKIERLAREKEVAGKKAQEAQNKADFQTIINNEIGKSF